MKMRAFGILVTLLLLLAAGTRAASSEIYLVYLYYNHGQLVFDRDYDNKVEVQQGSVVGFSGSFKAEVLDEDNSVLGQYAFDPRPHVFADPGGLKFKDQGKTALQLPYFPTGIKLQIYDASGQMILQYDLSDLAQVSLTLSPSGQNASTPNSSTAWYWWVLAIFVLLAIIFWVLRWRQRKNLVQQ